MNAREHALCDLVRLGFPTAIAERIVRQLPAIQRAHEAECNWPEHIAAPFTLAGAKAFGRIALLIALKRPAVFVGQPGLSGMGVRPKLSAIRQRDPRGCCVELWPAHTLASVRDRSEPIARLCARGFTVAQIERIDRAADRARKAG